jgi:type IV pilus assembly protein PilQ
MKTLRFLRSLSGRIRVCGVAITLLLRSLAVDAAIPPLPPLPETFPGTLSTDQFAVESPSEVVAQAPDEDTSWLAPVKPPDTPAPAAAPDATPPL